MRCCLLSAISFNFLDLKQPPATCLRLNPTRASARAAPISHAADRQPRQSFGSELAGQQSARRRPNAAWPPSARPSAPRGLRCSDSGSAGPNSARGAPGRARRAPPPTGASAPAPLRARAGRRLPRTQSQLQHMPARQFGCSTHLAVQIMWPVVCASKLGLLERGHPASVPSQPHTCLMDRTTSKHKRTLIHSLWGATGLPGLELRGCDHETGGLLCYHWTITGTNHFCRMHLQRTSTHPQRQQLRGLARSARPCPGTPASTAAAGCARAACATL